MSVSLPEKLVDELCRRAQERHITLAELLRERIRQGDRDRE